MEASSKLTSQPKPFSYLFQKWIKKGEQLNASTLGEKGEGRRENKEQEQKHISVMQTYQSVGEMILSCKMALFSSESEIVDGKLDILCNALSEL